MTSEDYGCSWSLGPGPISYVRGSWLESCGCSESVLVDLVLKAWTPLNHSLDFGGCDSVISAERAKSLCWSSGVKVPVLHCGDETVFGVDVCDDVVTEVPACCKVEMTHYLTGIRWTGDDVGVAADLVSWACGADLSCAADVLATLKSAGGNINVLMATTVEKVSDSTSGCVVVRFCVWCWWCFGESSV